MNTIALRLYLGVLASIMGLIVFHAPLSVGVGALFPALELVAKVWKELLLLFALPVGMWLLWRAGLMRVLRQDWLFVAIAAYALLHILLGFMFARDWPPVVAGWFIDLRFMAFFVAVYVAVLLQPTMRRTFLAVTTGSAMLAVAFAVLQVTVLPKDILAALGYSKATIAPYLTVDNNPALVRINGTLRGPNPLGAYLVIVMAAATALWAKTRRWPWVVAAAVAGASLALWATYSRSAWVAAGVALLVVAVALLGRKVSARQWAVGGLVVLVAAGGLLYALRGTTVVQQLILHDDPTTQSPVNSNEQHAESLAIGLSRMATQPFGMGPGSTGSASLYGEQPLIIENQYLFIAHEAGWFGLGLFMAIFGGVMQRLWQRRADWLALSVFASGAGLGLIGLLQPVWVDDTVSLVWWSLAAIALAAPQGAILKHYGKHAPQQKTA